MKSGYRISWTPHALSELKETIEYLQENFSDKEIAKLEPQNTVILFIVLFIAYILLLIVDCLLEKKDKISMFLSLIR